MAASNIHLFFSVATVCLLSFSIGTIYTWVSPVFLLLHSESSFKNPLDHVIKTSEMSLLASMSDIGTLFGSALAYLCIDRFGRKNLLQSMSVFVVASYLVVAFATRIELFYFGRALGGVACGVGFSVLPIYIAEISHKANRGFHMCLINTLLFCGQLYILLFGHFFRIKTLSLVCLVPPVIFGLGAFFVPESHYFYVRRNDRKSAEKSLFFVRRDMREVKSELEEVDKDVSASRSGIRDVLRNRGLRYALLICIGIRMSSQFSGITMLAIYMQPIFEEADFSLSSSVQSMMLVVIKILFGVLPFRLIDHKGRRFLFNWGSIGCTVSHIILGVFFQLKQSGFDTSDFNFVPLIGLSLFSMFFCVGVGPVTNAALGELFPPDSRAAGGAICSILGSVFGYITTAMFPPVMQSLGIATVFWFYAFFCAVISLFGWFYLPETKKQSLYEIQQSLSKPI